MRWSNVLRLYRRRVRARLVQELFAFTGIAAGVALLFAVQVSNTSLTSSITRLDHALIGNAQLQLRARDARGFPERLVARVERSPDVAAAAPVLEAPANLLGPRGTRAVTLVGADRRLVGIGDTLLPRRVARVPPELTALVLPSGVARAVGARRYTRTRLQIAGHTRDAPTLAALGHRTIGALADAPIAIVPIAFGQRLAGLPGRVTRLFVLARPGREAAVRRLLTRLAGDRLDVRAAEFDARVFAQAARPNDESTSLFSRVTALVGFLFALNAMLLMASERRRSIAELRISGHGRRTVRRVLLLDALVLGVVASLAGLALGDQLSRHVFPPAPGYLTLAFPIGTARTVPWQTIALALASGVAAALLGTLAPLLGRRVDAIGDERLDPDAARRLLTPRWRLLGGGLTGLAATAVVLVAAPTAATLGVALLFGSMLLCLPALLALALALARRLARTARSPVAVLAIGELRANGSRSVTLASIAAIAVCASGAVEGARHDLQAGLARAVHDVTATTDVWVSPASAANALGVASFGAAARDAVARLPHVVAVDVDRAALLTLGDRRVWVVGPPRDARTPVPASQIVQGDPAVANARVRAGRWAAVSQALAAERHLRLGGAFTLAATRPTTFRVAAIITNLGWSPGTIIVNADAFGTAWGTTDASALEVRFDRATSPARGRALVARALAHGPWSGLAVATATARERERRQTSRDGLVRLTQIARLVLLTAALAMAIALGAMIWQRRPGLATLKLGGIRRTRLYGALLLEIALLLAIGCVTGAAFALLGVQLLDRWLTALTGFPVERSSGALSALASLATVVLVALAATAAPGYRATGVPADVAFDG